MAALPPSALTLPRADAGVTPLSDGRAPLGTTASRALTTRSSLGTPSAVAPAHGKAGAPGSAIVAGTPLPVSVHGGSPKVLSASETSDRIRFGLSKFRMGIDTVHPLTLAEGSGPARPLSLGKPVRIGVPGAPKAAPDGR